MPEVWRRAFAEVPRHAFLPDVVWLRRPDGEGHERCERVREPGRWWAAAYADVPVVVQVCDGDPPQPGGNPWPSSSASQPSIVADMLLALQVGEGRRVLEVGTGTGWNAGLLAHRLGGAEVVTIEVDASLARAARERLRAVGLHPTVVGGDGADGWAPGAPYDRIIATAAVTHIPPAWVRQLRPGGLIVAPWASAWTADGLFVGRVDVDGYVRGGFRPGGAFMHLRGHRSRITDVDQVARPEHSPTTGSTEVSPWDVAGGDRTAEFAIGVTAPGLWQHWEDDPAVDGVRSRLWVGDEAGTSWASVDYDGVQLRTFAVRQHGPRRVWDEIVTAWHGWSAAGRPGVDAYGLTVAPDGRHRVWLSNPTDAPGPLPDPAAISPPARR
nr:methyltransferase domain-containing protein [Streptomyces sp. SID3343]